MKESQLLNIAAVLLIAMILAPLIFSIAFLFGLGFILESNEPYKHMIALIVFWAFCFSVKFAKEFSVPGIQVIWNSFFEDEDQSEIKD